MEACSNVDSYGLITILVLVHVYDVCTHDLSSFPLALIISHNLVPSHFLSRKKQLCSYNQSLMNLIINSQFPQLLSNLVGVIKKRGLLISLCIFFRISRHCKAYSSQMKPELLGAGSLEELAMVDVWVDVDAH
uniref:Uncharacterized protein n=1 Tax=Triticum urartu TaxID=4572 RepID=A0A8R7UDE8_TRIUA